MFYILMVENMNFSQQLVSLAHHKHWKWRNSCALRVIKSHHHLIQVYLVFYLFYW